MTNEQLKDFFARNEWVDNSKVKILRGCHRKAFLHTIGPTGVPLSLSVGDGANFGSAIHAALQRYYNGWGQFDEATRRVHGHRAFAEVWQEFFPTERMQSKHKLDNGLDILTSYFDQYLPEDELYEPVEAELGFANKIVPEVIIDNMFDKGEPFYYVGRVDGIFRRIADSTYWLRETKTVGGDAEKRLAQLKFDNQPVGYLATLRELNRHQYKISGVLGDVIAVLAQKRQNCRGYFSIDDQQCRDWKSQLIITVQRWRAIRAEYESTNDLNVFDQDTERCHDYGRCAFYELCDYGLNSENLSQFEPSTWHPLLQHTPAKIEIS